MNKLRIGENPTKVKSEDLTRIRGIGQTKQQWLRKLVGIGTIQELANASVDKLESQLKNKGHSVSRREVEAWITQAKKLTNQSSDSLESKAEEAEELPQLSLESKAEEALEAGGDFESYSYRLPITHYPLPITQFTLEITEIGVFKASNTERPILVDLKTRKFLGSIRKEEFFSLEVSFRVSKVSDVELVDIANKHITYNIQSQARNRSTGAILALGDTTPQTLVQDKNSYTIMLPATTLPLGLYRLRILVMLQGVLAIPGYCEIPLLPVV